MSPRLVRAGLARSYPGPTSKTKFNPNGVVSAASYICPNPVGVEIFFIIAVVGNLGTV